MMDILMHYTLCNYKTLKVTQVKFAEMLDSPGASTGYSIIRAQQEIKVARKLKRESQKESKDITATTEDHIPQIAD